MMESDQETKKLKKELEDKETKLQLAEKIQANTLAYPTCQIS